MHAKLASQSGENGGAALFVTGMDPKVPFVVLLGSGTRRAGDMASHADPSSQLVVLVDTKLGLRVRELRYAARARARDRVTRLHSKGGGRLFELFVCLYVL